jgi:tripartite-type tricarboxylate transporter receptor subunit TctC
VIRPFRSNAVRLPRRKFLKLATGATASTAVPGFVAAQSYPSRPIHLITGFAAGGASDLIARLIGQQLSERLGQPLVVEARPGAASNLATEIVARASPDGYTLLEMTASNAWNTALYDNLQFDFIRDIVPVAGIYRSIGVLVVHPSFPSKTLPEFVAYLKANPGKVSMASGGIGSPHHLWGALFLSMAGVDMLHVPFRGGGPALADLLGGHVQVLFDTLATSIARVRSGELRALGVTSATRSDLLKDVPAIAEVIPGYEAEGWQGIGAPSKTPPAIIDRLNKQVNAALTDPKFGAQILDYGAAPFPGSPAEFRTFVVEYTEKWAKVIRAANIKAERPG